ncbi:MAG TPA: xanthine dehydrogenase family protein molybdopterin-binding subunit [Halobacteriales archaeon]|uniref:xanthine dehydrogenase family protein molybdopterin-binding subunit n=1 Tax=Candidatus Hikarchaeum yamanae TaxID=2675326 RepID=UPI0018534622|nr:xanthine dehydrogenase family protein molybdopterin-binding subunit [Halobacteriales archaeon]|tara:strand:+ start:10761 stop:13136 length:2376 start_codon:yes stop_codon:yes gene_type:complete
MSHTAETVTNPTDVVDVGDRIVRREDGGLVTGKAQYTDDYSAPGMLYAAILRSQYAYAKISSVDTSLAEAHEDVVAVYTAQDVEASGVLGEVLSPVGLLNPGPDSPVSIRTELFKPFRPMLAKDIVRYTGEGIAVVVATDRYSAYDALDLIDVKYESLKGVTGISASTDTNAPQLHEGAPGNISYDWENGNKKDVEVAFSNSDHVVELDLVLPRLIPNAIEPRVALADYSPSSGKLSIKLSSQGAFGHRNYFSKSLGIPLHKVHVTVPAVGGGFGSKSKFYAGELLCAWCSVQLGLPVKWQNTRSEAHITDAQGRSHATKAKIAFNKDGTFTALEAHTYLDIGAYVSTKAPLQTGGYGVLLSGLYKIPAVFVRMTGVFTNSAPVDAYRGAGRPEAAFVVERLVYLAAKKLGMDPVEIRRKNFVPKDEFPYKTPIIAEYDCGDYEAALDLALKTIDYEGLRKEQISLRNEGRYIGIGLCSFIERSGGGTETAKLRIHPTGAITAYVGSADCGQGHQTPFTQLISQGTGVQFKDIEIVAGDSEILPSGTGSFGSRTGSMAGSALLRCTEQVVEKGEKIAAHILDTTTSNISFENSTFHATDSPDDSVTFAEVAAAAYGNNLPDGVESGFEITTVYENNKKAWPYGTHIAVVEVDVETGEVKLKRYVGVDDVGTILNPMIVEGQIVGGIVQGIGQALFEQAVYDNSGNLVSGTLQDYAMPRAMHLPDIETDHIVTPTPSNLLGTKGAGESGTIGSPASIANAVSDALESFGVSHIDLPITDEKVWQSISEATSS